MRVIDVELRTELTVPLAGGHVAAGFPSPAEDHEDKPLDFNELIVANPAATFAVRVVGDSMTGVGIFDGDIAAVDRSTKPVDGAIIVALVDGEFTIKRLRMSRGRIWLQAENPAFNDIIIGHEGQLEVWGVVRRSVRMLAP